MAFQCQKWYDLSMEKEVAAFVSVLLHSSTVTHFMHWATDSYAKHQALGEYYDAIIELVDEYAEAFMGKYGQLKTFPEDFHLSEEPVDYLNSIKDFIEQSREHLPKDTELMNLVDEIADQVNSTLYKLRFLS